MEWKNGEAGPTCACGMPTMVMVGEQINLVCLFHQTEYGIVYPLPKDRPDNWPHLSDDEMTRLVDRGFTEQGLLENSELEIDATKVLN